MRGTARTKNSSTNNVSLMSFVAAVQKKWLHILLPGAICLGLMSLLPIFLIETSVQHKIVGGSLSVQDLIHNRVQRQVVAAPPNLPGDKTRTTKDGRTLLNAQLNDLIPDSGFVDKPVARGVAGRPLDQTPALQGGVQRAHIDCDVNIDSLAYWNDATIGRDSTFESPFRTTPDPAGRVKYISFSSDQGGWNNVRMSLEILFALAAATGRTLVLPPKEPLYLMHLDKVNRYRGFADFFPIHTAAFQQRVKVITFEEFLKAEQDRMPVPDNLKEAIMTGADHCDKREKSSASCKNIFDYLAQIGTTPELSASRTCLIFDQHKYETGHEPNTAVQEYVHTVCGDKRDVVYWTKDNIYDEPALLHFKAADKEYRLLTHFYAMIHFTDPAMDNYFKRFVRDYLHYHDAIYCAAGKIVKAIQVEGMARGFSVKADDGSGAFSALHVRRGDLQYKKVKIPAQEWYDNTKEVWEPHEILYVATDERDKSFFDDLAKHHDLRFLDDYWDLAGLGDLDPNYMGMIDTIVASRGRAFAGTWFSTFSGYINRLRGYHGMSMMDSWYSFLPKKTAVHEWREVADFAYAYEWPDGWVGIDADDRPTRDTF